MNKIWELRDELIETRTDVLGNDAANYWHGERPNARAADLAEQIDLLGNMAEAVEAGADADDPCDIDDIETNVLEALFQDAKNAAQSRTDELVTGRYACHAACPLTLSDEHAAALQAIKDDEILSDRGDALREMKYGKGL